MENKMVKLPFRSFKITGRSQAGYEVYSGEKTGLPKEFGSIPDLQPEEMLFIAVYLGERPTGGYRIKPVDISLEKSRLRVRYKEEKPTSAFMVSQAFSYPALLLAVEKEFLPSGPLRVILEQK